VGIHIHLEPPIGIRDLDADASRACFHPQLGIDEGHFALDGLRRVSADHDGCAGTDLDRGQIALRYVSDDPEVAMVGDPVELLAGLYALTVDDLLLDHIAGCRRGPIEGAWTDAFFAHFADAALRNCEVAQSLQGALDVSVSVGGCDAAPAL